MESSASNRPRLFAATALFLLTAILGLILLNPKGLFGGGLIQESYDTLHQLGGEQSLPNCPVLIVYLDRASFQHLALDPKQPWPRDLHGRLLDRLTAAGARAVVFDILFAETGTNAAADQAFADAIQKNGRVVLASEYNVKSTH